MISVARKNYNELHAGTINPIYDIHETSENNDVNNADNL